MLTLFRFLTPSPVSSHPALLMASVADAMSYFRAVLLSNEFSTRTLHLSKAVIDLNTGNYTAWSYSTAAPLFSTLKALSPQSPHRPPTRPQQRVVLAGPLDVREPKELPDLVGSPKSPLTAEGSTAASSSSAPTPPRAS